MPAHITPTISPLTPADRPQWQALVEGYKAFYQTPTTQAEYDAAWQRLHAGHEVWALGARADGVLLGIAHALVHRSVWAERVVYLQDLFTAPAARGQGVATALIQAVAAEAKRQNATRCYWLTHEHNHTARSLYDRVGQSHGFVRYDWDMARGV